MLKAAPWQGPVIALEMTLEMACKEDAAFFSGLVLACFIKLR